MLPLRKPSTHRTKKRPRRALLIGMCALIIIIPLAVFLARTPRSTQASWSSSHRQWVKRQNIPVVNNSGTSLSADTTIAITVNTQELVDAGKLQSDCSDLRVLYQPNNATATELPHYLSYSGGATCATSEVTKVHFSLQAALANNAITTSYYLYYTNPDAPAPTNQIEAFDIDSKQALLVCPFDGTTECVNADGAENPTTETGAIRYSGAKSALSFDGHNTSTGSLSDNVSYTGTGLDNLALNDMTIETWLYWRDNGRDQNDVLFSTRASSGGWGMGLYERALRVVFDADCATDARIHSANNSISYHQWHHIALTWTAATGTAKIFINGTETSSYVYSDACVGGVADDSANTFYVGRDWNVLNHFPGILDEVRISNTIRYTGSFTPQTTPFVRDEYTKLLYHFDENGNDPRNTGKAIDDSGNGNHGTITGAKYVGGLVGVDNGTTDTGKAAGGNSYAGHEGIFIEVATTNKITNPSFEHGTYDTAWTASASATLTENTTAPYYKFGTNSALYDSAHVRNLRADLGATYVTDLYRYTTTKRLAQGFQVTSNISPSYVSLHSARVGTSASKYIRAEIQTDDSGVPSGIAVTNGTSSCVQATSFTTATKDNVFTFSTPPSLTTSTQYHLVFRSFTDSGCTTEQSAADTSNYITWHYNNSNTYANGSRATMDESGTWTTSSTTDFIFALGISDSTLTTSVNAGNTNTHTLSAYVYNPNYNLESGALSSTYAELVFNGSTQTTTYTDLGGGWWRLSYSAAAGSGSQQYGIQVKAGYYLYVDGVQLEEKPPSTSAYATTYADGSLGTGYSWSGTEHDSTSSRTVGNLVYSKTDNISSTAGSISVWVKTNINPTSTLASTNNVIVRATDQANGYVLEYQGWPPASFRLTKHVSSTGYPTYQNVTLAANTWYHLVATWDTTNGTRLYMNAGTPGTNSNTSDPGSTTDVSLGVSGYGGLFVTSDLRIFNTSLTSTEVADLYYSGLISRGETYEVDRFGSENERPIAIYHFDEASGTTAYDSSTYGHHLTLYGSPTRTVDSQTSNPRQHVLQFDGTNDTASTSALLSQKFNMGTSAFTLSGWFKAPARAPASNQFLLAKYKEAGYGVYLNTTGQLCFGIDDDSTWTPDDTACTTQTYIDSTWNHFAAVKTTTTLTLYINGTSTAQDTSLSATTTLDNSSGFFIGAFSATSGFFEGLLDQIVIYNYARSESQIKTDFAGLNSAASFGRLTTDPFSDGLMGHWKLDEVSADSCGSSNDACDSSGNDYHGTWTGNATSGAGKFGSGVTLDGTGDYIEVEDINL